MCAGAILNARIDKLVFGANEQKSGSAISKFNVFENAGLNHKVLVESGVLESQCKKLLQDFFSELRIKDKINFKKNK